MKRRLLIPAMLLSCHPALLEAADPVGVTAVAQHPVVFDAPPRQLPSDGPTDAPLLGNGDFLAAFGGRPDQLRVYLCKADLWELRPDGGPRSLGRLEVDLPAMAGGSWRIEQDLQRAVTTGIFKKGSVTLKSETVLSATENLLWVKLSSDGGEVAGSASLLAPGGQGRPSGVVDNDSPVTIGRENYGGGRYYFDGEIGDVRVSGDPAELLKAASNKKGKPAMKPFDGKTTFQEIAVPKLSQGVGVSAWIKINRTGEANFIVSKGEWNQAYSLGLSGGCLRWSIGDSFVQTEKPLENGRLYQITATFDGRAMKLLLDGKQVAGTESASSDGVQVVERAFKPGQGGIVRESGAACALRVAGGDGRAFTVAPGKPVYLVVAASGLANTADYRADASRRAAAVTAGSIIAGQRKHEAWWADFWGKSFVEIPDKNLERHYYLSHYAMGCASRLSHFPPALYGWTVGNGTPTWGGAYFNNYNFFAPFYGLYAANHIEQAMPCNDVVIDALELGRDCARDEAKYEGLCSNSSKLKDAPGILLPVSMLPYGIAGAPTTWGQRSNASYGCVPLSSTWQATRDVEFARKAYPFVREVATFWEHFLVFENGRYVDRNDAVLENSGRDTNPLHTLALIRLVMDLAVDMSGALKVDEPRREKWTDIRDHLSDYPQCTVGDLPPDSRIEVPKTPENLRLPIFRFSEQGRAWQNDNAVGIQHIFPGNGIGLGVRTDLLERARNQVRVMARWVDLNGCNSFYPAAVRVGHDPDEILSRLRHWSDTCNANGMRADNPHGTEMFSVVPCTIQEMLMQSFDGTIRLFPNWPKNQDARFGTLRARGAFLVSAELKGGVVSGVSIRSERGGNCVLVNPWPGRKVKVTRGGKSIELAGDERLTIETRAGESLAIDRVADGGSGF